jgi:hypothetical protein
MRILEASAGNPAVSAHSLEVLQNAPVNTEKQVFFQVLALRLRLGDYSALEQILEQALWRDNQRGGELIAHAISELAGKKELLDYAVRLRETGCVPINAALAVALGGRYSGASRQEAVTLLMDLIDDPEPDVRAKAIRSLRLYFGPRADGDQTNGRDGDTERPDEQTLRAWRNWWESRMREIP